LNTNVGDMPLEIFADYTADTLGIEFPWIYLIPTNNGGFYSHDAINFTMPGHGNLPNIDSGYGEGFFLIEPEVRHGDKGRRQTTARQGQQVGTPTC